MDVMVRQVSPFLKWAGGKRWLAEKHLERFPTVQKRYLEPFLGSASVFFKLNPQDAILSDANPRLIECYEQISTCPTAVEAILLEHAANHSKDHYYEVRAAQYQQPAARAAQFLYLNRTCWNGLYRVNRKGEFNVPKGTKENVILPSDDFLAVSHRLRNARLQCCDFEATIDQAVKGDLVYADPPYTVQHNFNGFLKYNEKIFSWADQIRLRDAVVRAANRGVHVVVSNAAHSSVIELYEGLGSTLTIKRSSVLAASSLNRGTVDEILVLL
jgi:DNA adenine methylase